MRDRAIRRDQAYVAVERLAGVFLDTGGDLRALTLALIDLEAARQQPLAKIRTPFDLVVAT